MCDRATSFASVLLGVFYARVALDVAAPVERAPTLLGPGELVCVVTAAAAHQVTAVRSCEQDIVFVITIFHRNK